MRIYVDMDGTLLHGWLDNMFKEMNYDTTWYDTQWVDDLAINHELVQILKEHQEKGDELILWTNRSLLQRDMTRANLGELWDMFKEHQFHAGKKHNTNTDGFTYDNEAKYVATNGQLISW